MCRFKAFSLVIITAFFSSSGLADTCTNTQDLEKHNQTSARLKINQIQTIGTHNSYKRALPAAELSTLAELLGEETAESLDYSHVSLEEQLNEGARQIELDIYYDPAGGRFTSPLLPEMTKNQPGSREFDPSVMASPGFKVFHMQDIDIWSNCPLLEDCLTQIRDWSLSNPEHVPILLMFNTKQQKLPEINGTDPLPYTSTAFDVLEKAFLAVFDSEQLITPDKVRGKYTSLRQAVLAGNWPSLEQSRGKFILLVDEGIDVTRAYLNESNNLNNKLFFINSVSSDDENAAIFVKNNPIEEQQEISALVKQGFMVRTRADASTREARNNDTRRFEAALEAGAQYITTDYLFPREEWSSYSVRLPDNNVARCNAKAL